MAWFILALLKIKNQNYKVGDTMTDTEKFKEAVLSRGLKYGFLAEALHISRSALWMKINNGSEFKASEITTLAALMELSLEERDAIFFAENVS